MFGSSGKKFHKPPPTKGLELHAFSDGGGAGLGMVIFVRWEQTPGKFSMRRIFASSRIVSSSSSMSVPRRELNGIVMVAKKALEFSETLGISKENVFLHTDSYICLYWLKKHAGDLAIYISNRVKIIQDSQIEVFHCQTDTNPADYVSKVKPTSSYLDNPVWEYGPDYMEIENWQINRRN